MIEQEEAERIAEPLFAAMPGLAYAHACRDVVTLGFCGNELRYFARSVPAQGMDDVYREGADRAAVAYAVSLLTQAGADPRQGYIRVDKQRSNSMRYATTGEHASPAVVALFRALLGTSLTDPKGFVLVSEQDIHWSTGRDLPADTNARVAGVNGVIAVANVAYPASGSQRLELHKVLCGTCGTVAFMQRLSLAVGGDGYGQLADGHAVDCKSATAARELAKSWADADMTEHVLDATNAIAASAASVDWSVERVREAILRVIGAKVA